MITLGIESTAHTFGVGITKNTKVLANCKDAFTTKKGGIIPYKVQHHHVKVCKRIIIEALKEANLTMKDVRDSKYY